MKEISRQLGIFLFEVLKKLDWQLVLYKTCKSTVLPMIKDKVEDSSSKIDDIIYNGIEQLVEKFLAPNKVE